MLYNIKYFDLVFTNIMIQIDSRPYSQNWINAQIYLVLRKWGPYAGCIYFYFLVYIKLQKKVKNDLTIIT